MDGVEPHSRSEDRLPDRIGRYAIRAILGRGGFSNVYLGEAAESGASAVAIKLIDPTIDGEAILRRFETEQPALDQLAHPNLAGLYETGLTEGGAAYFAMELVRGESLTAYCDRQQLTIRERVEVFLPVCRAVDQAHRQGLLHLDLKPSNIIVTEVDGRSVPKVVDWGISRAVDDVAGLWRGNGPKKCWSIGALFHVSPELVMGKPDIDVRSDIYSLGVILHELLVGRPPIGLMGRPGVFECLRGGIQTPSTLFARNHVAHYAAASRRSTEEDLKRMISGDLDSILHRALTNAREERYGSVQALVEDLERFFQRTSGRGGASWSPLARWLPRRSG